MSAFLKQMMKREDTRSLSEILHVRGGILLALTPLSLKSSFFCHTLRENIFKRRRGREV